MVLVCVIEINGDKCPKKQGKLLGFGQNAHEIIP